MANGQERGPEGPQEPMTPEQMQAQMQAMQQEMQAMHDRVEFLEARNEALEQSHAQLHEVMGNVADELSERDDEESQNLANQLRTAADAAVIVEPAADQEEAAGAVRRQRGEVPPTQVHETVEEPKRRRFGKIAAAAGAAALIAIGALWAADKDDAKPQSETAAQTSTQTSAATKKAQAAAVTRMNGNTDVTRINEQAKANTAAQDDQAPKTKRVVKKHTDKATWRETTTVNRAVMRMESTPDTLKQNIRKIFDAAPKDASHVRGMQNRLHSFNPDTISRYDVVEAAAFGANGDYGNALAQYNALHGKPANTPSKVSHEEMKKYIENFMTADGTRFEEARADGFYENTGQHSDKEVFTQNQYFNNLRVVKVVGANGQELILKIGGGTDGKDAPCINVLQKKQAAVVTPKAPQGGIGGPSEATPVDNPRVPHNPSKPGSTPKDTPKKPSHKPGDTPEDKPTKPVKPQQEDERKHDDGKLPGSGVPADQDKGTPDKPGTAPATPGNSPADVPRQPQDPVPAPQRPSSETEGRPPAEEGQGPANPNPNGSATVPGTSNNQGQGGSVDPSAR